MLLEYWGAGTNYGKGHMGKKAGASCSLLPTLLCWKACEASHSPGWWMTPLFRGTSQ